MSCKDKIKYTCSGNKVYAVCTEYQGTIPIFSYLTLGCLDVEEVLEDTYHILSDIKNDIDVTSMTNDCITFTTPKTVKSVIEQMYDKICELKAKNDAQDIVIAALTTRVTNIENNNCP